MNIDLSGKIAVVTGAASGLGQACAVSLANAGAAVVAVDVNSDGARETIDLIGAGSVICCDLSKPLQVQGMRDRVLSELGSPHIIVNCAGIISYRSGIGAVSVEEWNSVMDVNLRGTFLVCRAFMDDLKSGGGGRIITISSMAARAGGIDVGMHYTASKSGLIGLTRSLAKEGGLHGITANAVAPGIILTKPVEKQIFGRHDDYESQIPLGRLGNASDVAGAVTFLSSPFASYISGVVLDVNGGMYMA